MDNVFETPLAEELKLNNIEDDIVLGAPPTQDIRQAVLERAKVSKDKAQLVSKGPRDLATAREEVHITGTSSMKVRKFRKSNNPKHKHVDEVSKAERKKQIHERRVASEKKKNWMAPVYEGLGFDFKVQDATIDNFKIMFESIINKAKEAINGSKHVIEHVIRLDSDELLKIVSSIAVMATGVGFTFAFNDAGLLVKFLIAAITAIGASWPFLLDIRDYLIKKALVMFTGFDGDKWERDRDEEIANMTEEEREYLDELYQEGKRLHELEQAEKNASASTSSDHENGWASWFDAHYEGVFDSGLGPKAFVLAELATSVVSMVTGFMMTGKTKGLAKQIVDSHKLKADFQCILTEIMTWVADCIDKIFKTNFKTMFNKNKELDSWGSAVGEMYEQFSSGTMEMNSENARLINNLMLRGMKIASQYAVMSAAGSSYHRFCMGMINKMESVLGAAGVPLAERQVPLTICLRGESGIGKSYIQHALVDEIAMRALKGNQRKAYNENHLNEKYMWLSEEDHANGYNGQFCTIFDDFGQFLTQKGQADDFQRIIRMANAMPCRLNAAELERKGKLVFTSPLILCSTNLYEFWSPSLAKPEALIRRFDVWVEMVPRREFCTEATKDLDSKSKRLDRSKLIRKIEYDACEYRILECTDAAQQVWSVKEIANFERLVEICSGKYLEHKTNHKGLMEALAERREELLEEPQYEGWFDWFSKPKATVKQACDSMHTQFCKYRDNAKMFMAKKYFEYMDKDFKAKALIIVAVLGVIILAVLAFKVIKYFCKKLLKTDFVDGPAYEAELLREGEPALFHNKLIHSILEKNVYHMYKPGADCTKEDSVGTVTMVTGTKGLMNLHYITQLEEINKMTVKPFTHIEMVNHGTPNRKFQVPVEWFIDNEHYAQDADSDLCIVEFDRCFPIHRDIIKHFVTDETIEQNRDFNVAVFAARSPHYLNVFDVSKKRVTQPIRIAGNVHTDLFTYEADTLTGDCGSLVAYTGDYANTIERIVGIHMAGLKAGTRKLGYASLITQSKVRALCNALKWQPKIDEDVVVEGKFLKLHDTCHNVVAKLDRPIYQPTKSAIVKSELYGAIAEPTKRPAALSRVQLCDGITIDPLINAHLRQDSYNTVVDAEMLKLVVNDVIKTMKPFIKNRGVKLDFEDAVTGNSSLPCLKAIPRQTSAGFSYKDDPRVRKGKKDFFGYGADYEFDNQLTDELRERVRNTIKLAELGVVPMDRVYTDILKDETLPNEKVDIGKTRMISACDLHMSIVYRMYYGALCNDIVNTRIVNGICVGVNPYSKEWEFLARSLTSRGEKVIAGDFSGYDNSQSCQLIKATLDVMSALTGHESEEDKKVMEVLGVTLAQPYHASRGYVYELDHGMPSGNPMTTVMNSIFGLIAFRLCWLSCTRERFTTPIESLAAFNRDVALFMYGDDNLLNVADRSADLFNQNTMMSHFPKFGLKYTSDKKSDENPPPHRKITEVTFLKRSFTYNKLLGRHVASLEMDTINNMLHWTKKGGSARSITLDNCDNAMREWSFHGREIYDRNTKLLVKEVKERMEHDIFVEPYEIAVMQTAGYKPDWVREHA